MKKVIVAILTAISCLPFLIFLTLAVDKNPMFDTVILIASALILLNNWIKLESVMKSKLLAAIVYIDTSLFLTWIIHLKFEYIPCSNIISAILLLLSMFVI